MELRGWQRTSLIEYPGKISTVLFSGGCNFRCPFCYNRDLVLNPRKMGQIRESAVLEYLLENKGLYHAAMVTGGEPTMNPDLPDFLLRLRSCNLLTGIETNGTNPRMLESLIKKGLVNFVSMDVKAPLVWEKYKAAAGIRQRRLFENVKRSIKILLRSKIDYEFRTTIVPGIHELDDIVKISKSLRGAKKYVLQQFLPQNTIEEGLKRVRPYPAKQLLELRRKIKPCFGSVEVRNV